ncbi:unnamed protein product [Bursaphelenchus xylophilus]|uniref:Proteasome subunit beta n=1 Tax=Bursaphelenchus xylophilus TaxID=6326 RepID=A0A1I7SE80_BURXY|nr:unnamed protein product [Bursaphelenchus xylophilus]CAG9088638.1 unnamed protein product [Bursaphelenchus xylophilus]
METMEKIIPTSHSLNPTVTGTSALAVTYDGGVAIATDRVASYGKTARYKHIPRQYRVNENVVVAFGGDHADFQWLQNVIERVEEDHKSYDSNIKLTARGLYNYLCSLLYYRRSKMDPLWNTLIVAGMNPEPTYDELAPFIGVITQRGVAYEAKSVATGMGQMLLNESLERATRDKGGKLNKEEALDLIRTTVQLGYYHDCCADNEIDLTVVDKEGTHLLKPETFVGDWSLAEYNCQYE